MDCVRTAVRQNAKSVKCLYRRDRENMPGSAREVYNAEEEGVEFIWLSSPKKFTGSEKVSSVIIEKMKLDKTDSSGRKKPIPIPDSNLEIISDLVIAWFPTVAKIESFIAPYIWVLKKNNKGININIFFIIVTDL